MALCKACGGRITFIPTRNQKRMPVDATSSEVGTVLLEREDWAGLPVARVLTGAELELARADDVPLYRPHWATCTDPAAFRRRHPSAGPRPASRYPGGADVVVLEDKRRERASPTLPGV